VGGEEKLIFSIFGKLYFCIVLFSGNNLKPVVGGGSGWEKRNCCFLYLVCCISVLCYLFSEFSVVLYFSLIWYNAQSECWVSGPLSATMG